MKKQLKKDKISLSFRMELKNKISLIGKILAVADTVEAVTNARPYRRPLGLKTAIEILKKGRNNIFDRQVVKACLIVLRDGFKF